MAIAASLITDTSAYGVEARGPFRNLELVRRRYVLQRLRRASRATFDDSVFKELYKNSLGQAVVEHMGFEPTTSGLQSPRSPS